MRKNGTKFGLDQKIELKNFQSLPPNFRESLNKSYIKFRPFCMASIKVSEMRQIFNKIFKSVESTFSKIF